MPIPGMNREQMMEKKRLNKPYVSGAGPLPNDEFGDGHRQVNPAYSQQTNRAIGQVQPTDGNMMGLEDMYGKASASGGLQQKFGQVYEMFGDSTEAILDELLRISASEDVNGPMAPPSNTTMPGGEYGASGFPAPDFGSGQPYTTGPTGDGDLAALEQTMGYPVMANKTSGPVRNMPGQKRLKRR